MITAGAENRSAVAVNRCLVRMVFSPFQGKSLLVQQEVRYETLHAARITGKRPIFTKAHAMIDHADFRINEHYHRSGEQVTWPVLQRVMCAVCG